MCCLLFLYYKYELFKTSAFVILLNAVFVVLNPFHSSQERVDACNLLRYYCIDEVEHVCNLCLISYRRSLLNESFEIGHV